MDYEDIPAAPDYELSAADLAELEKLGDEGGASSHPRAGAASEDAELEALMRSQRPPDVVRPAVTAAPPPARTGSAADYISAGSAAEYHAAAAPAMAAPSSGAAAAAAAVTRTVTIALSPDAIALVHELAARMAELKARVVALNVSHGLEFRHSQLPSIVVVGDT